MIETLRRIFGFEKIDEEELKSGREIEKVLTKLPEHAKRIEFFCIARDGECPEGFDFERVWRSWYLGNCIHCKFAYFRFVMKGCRGC